MYNTVEEYFLAEYPDLSGMLNNSGGFWPEVKANTISNEDLERNIKLSQALGKYNSMVYRASVALMAGRLVSEVANPG